MKLTAFMGYVVWLLVAPLVGAWIEITAAGVTIILVDVAPLVGAWIEISSVYKQELAKCRSLLL